MKQIITIALLTLCSSAFAATVKIPMYTTDNKHSFIGNVIAKDTKHGLKLTPHLYDLTPGNHGFHIHDKPNCDNVGMAAGGHLDPNNTGKHEGPNGAGHLGDLPILVVNKHGKATKTVTAPHLTTEMLHGHALIIHAGGDNYADKPAALGGGGARVACGVIK